MTPVEYSVKEIRQATSECLQTSAAQLISFFDPSITVEEVIQKVPLYVENGEKIGTSTGHLCTYLLKRGYATTCYIFDTELFDRTWSLLTPRQVLENLRAREAHIPENSWLAKYHHILVDGWEQYVAAGGSFSFEPLSVKLLRRLLDNVPFILLVNSTYLNQEAKQLYNKETDRFGADPIKGRSLIHAVTCTGYKDGEFLIVDPEPPVGVNQKRWIAQDHLIASIMAAQTESDNLLISIAK